MEKNPTITHKYKNRDFEISYEMKDEFYVQTLFSKQLVSGKYKGLKFYEVSINLLHTQVFTKNILQVGQDRPRRGKHTHKLNEIVYP